MSAPLYTTMPPPPRRHPLAAASSHYAVNRLPHHAYPPPAAPGTPPKQPQRAQQDKDKQKQKQSSSPPLPRQKAKDPPPSPPKIIINKARTLELMRVGMLGEGGFARVYEVQDAHGQRSACKVVTKSSLTSKKAKTKLYAEIKIHTSLNHPNVVRFHDCFEDDDNVYMTLELCHNGSLMDMLRRRKRFTEPEGRFYMVQLIGACHYMHTHQVIHRDLKLGNIFLDRSMNVKVGDFGLAALIETPGERKKTICGTPNYIAPEVLFDPVNGHSFEVDTWSIGVILYTLVIGRPPFQTKDVKAIYKRIRDNDYEFPADRAVSQPVQELVQHILASDPQLRPTLHEIVDHRWFTHGTVPGYIPTSAHDAAPDFRHIARHMSETNLARLRRNALLDHDQVTSIAVPSAPHANTTGSKPRTVTSSLAQQEKEFQKAIQPGSPIAALLSSASQPLIVALPLPDVAISKTSGSTKDQPFLRKLQASKDAQTQMQHMKSPVRVRGHGHGLQGITEEQEDEYGARVEELRKKELESQKARIVAQMVPLAGSGAGSVGGDDQELNAENVPPARTRDAARMLKDKERVLERLRENAKDKERQFQGERRLEKELRERQLEKERDTKDLPSPPLKMNSFDAAAQSLTAAFNAKAMGRLFRDPRQDAALPDPRLFIAAWLDYCNKYGLGYVLADGSVGVYFNDSTTVILSADKHHFDYISSRCQGAVYMRKNYTVAEYPGDLERKLYLVKHFEHYMMDKLYGDWQLYEDEERTKGMPFVLKFLRVNDATVFKLSHDVLQFNFKDHDKIVLSEHGLHVTHLNAKNEITRHTLSGIMATSLRPPVADPEQVKFNQNLVDKLNYCKELLTSIKDASQQIAKADAGDAENARPPAPARSVTARRSKASLR